MTPPRRRVAAVLTVAVLAVVSTGCSLIRTTSTDEEELDAPVQDIAFDLDSSDVTVSAGEETTVQRTIRHAGDPPAATHSVDDSGVLTLTECPDTGCDIEYTVVVGADATVHGRTSSGEMAISGLASAVAESNSGDVTLSDLTGPAEATSSSGNVTAQRIGGDLSAEVRSGDIGATDIGGDTTARSSSGDVALTLAVPANVDATAGSGNVTVTVPAGSYRVEVDAGSGDVTDDLTSAPDAEFTVRARTGSGDVHLAHP